MTDFQATEEQLEILKHFNKLESMKIHAYAGTGKTSTLKFLAEQTDRKGVALVFNKSMADEFKKIMPKNVISGTMHSFAFAWARNEFSDYKKLISGINNRVIQNLSDNLTIKGFTAYRVASTIRLCIEGFCNSSSPKFLAEHLPYEHQSFQWDLDVLKKHEQDLLETSQMVWEYMIDSKSEVPLGHSGYLKLWSLNKPNLEFDFLMLDEAHDISPVMFEAVHCFKGQIILVGDSYQQIYEWRGAEDAMLYPLKGIERYLTRTFRFGSELSELTNKVLKRLGASKEIRGLDNIKSTISIIRAKNPNAILFRKNASLAREVCSKYREGTDFFVNDPNKNIAKAIDDYFLLNDGKWGKSNTFQGFNSWESVLEIAKRKEEDYFQGFVDLFNSHDPKELQEAFLGSQVKSGLNHVTLSSVHQAKGMEWSIVELNEDMAVTSLYKENVTDEYLRLLYVAITRAKNTLHIPESLLDFCNNPLSTGNDR